RVAGRVNDGSQPIARAQEVCGQHGATHSSSRGQRVTRDGHCPDRPRQSLSTRGVNTKEHGLISYCSIREFIDIKLARLKSPARSRREGVTILNDVDRRGEDNAFIPDRHPLLANHSGNVWVIDAHYMVLTASRALRAVSWSMIPPPRAWPRAAACDGVGLEPLKLAITDPGPKLMSLATEFTAVLTWSPPAMMPLAKPFTRLAPQPSGPPPMDRGPTLAGEWVTRWSEICFPMKARTRPSGPSMFMMPSMKPCISRRPQSGALLMRPSKNCPILSGSVLTSSDPLEIQWKKSRILSAIHLTPSSSFPKKASTEMITTIKPKKDRERISMAWMRTLIACLPASLSKIRFSSFTA